MCFFQSYSHLSVFGSHSSQVGISSRIFNFEGGCYAKTINLDPSKEPDIFNAIKPGALLENVITDDKGVVDFSDGTITENTRVSYPINYIERQELL